MRQVKMEFNLKPRVDLWRVRMLYTPALEGAMKLAASLLWIGSLAAGSLLSAAPAGEEKTITGWVLDSACAFTKGLDKPTSRQCALACARKGSPLVILQDDGSIFWPISESMPAEGQNSRLLPYAGKRVTATGKVYARGGSQAVAIETISAASK